MLIGAAAIYVVSQFRQPDRAARVTPSPSPTQIELKFWGVFDQAAVFQPIIAAYEKAHPGVTIRYTQKEASLYEFASLNLLAAQDGPDIWLIPQDWLPKHADKLQLVPEGLLAKESRPAPKRRLFQPATPPDSNATLLSRRYVPVSLPFTLVDNQVLAIPLAVDTLGLFVNISILEAVGLTTIPQTWEAVVETVKKIAKRKGAELSQPAIGMGASRNVSQATDILATVMIQNHTPMINEAKDEARYNAAVTKATGEPFYPGREALDFYTSFASPTKENFSWSVKEPSDFERFAKGKLGLYIDYSFRLRDLEQANPNFALATAPLPQIAGTSQPVTLANGLVVGVPSVSKHSAEAWDFIQFLTNRQNSLTYAYASGRPPARLDLLSETGFNPHLRPFLLQLSGQKPAATVWYRNELNKTDTAFRSAIEAVLAGQSIESVTDTLTKQVTHILRQEAVSP